MRYDWDYGIPDKYTVVLTPGEADTLAKLLKKEQRALQKRVEKYRDILDGGEATERPRRGSGPFWTRRRTNWRLWRYS